MKPQHNPRTTFVTLDGIEIHFVPFSWDEYLLARQGLLDEYRERGEIIDCPQYKVEYASGSTRMLNHDADTIKQVPPGTPPEDVDRILAEQQATWDKYQDAQRRFNAEDMQLMMDFVYLDSLGGIKLPEDTAWEERQRGRRITIPADPEKKRRHYINTVLLKGRSDSVDLVGTIQAISMGAIKEDDVKAVVDSFRDRYWQQARGFFDTAKATNGAPAPQPA